MLKVLGVVEVDGRTGGVHVQQLPVRARREAHSRPSLELDFSHDAPAFEVERPELVVADLAPNAVRPLAAGCEREAHRFARPEGEKVYGPIHEIDASDPHHRAAVHWIRGAEESRVEAALLVDVVREEKVQAAYALLEESARQLPAVDLF